MHIMLYNEAHFMDEHTGDRELNLPELPRLVRRRAEF